MNSALRTEFALSGLTKHIPVLARLTDGAGLMPNTVKPLGLEQQPCLWHTYFFSFEFLMNKASYPQGEATYQQECIEHFYVSKTKTALEKTIVMALKELTI